MKMPNADLAVVDRAKVTGYLLNLQHRYGSSKARFFGGLGFCLHDWKLLAEALREHGQRHDVSRVKESPFGRRYEVDGALRAPAGRPRVRSVWQVGRGQAAPRLITAHPLEVTDD